MSKNPVIIWGGADIDPSLYGEPRAGCGWTNKDSDIKELARIDEAIAENKPIIGICRGLQMLTVHQKGKLIQHVTPQRGTKLITDVTTKKQIPINKAHHQVCVLNPEAEPQILAYSYLPTDDVFIPEVVYFPKINALGVQGHPEWAKDDDPITEYMFDKIKKYLKIEMTSWR